VDLAFSEGKHLPPVELHKIGERYFVYDGNHRGSVARHHGAAAIDALVTEFAPDNGNPPTPLATLDLDPTNT
jgi:hypothetical protein